MSQQSVGEIIVPLVLALGGGHISEHLGEHIVELLQSPVNLRVVWSSVLVFDPKAAQDVLNQVGHEFLAIVHEDSERFAMRRQDIMEHRDNDFARSMRGSLCDRPRHWHLQHLGPIRHHLEQVTDK